MTKKTKYGLGVILIIIVASGAVALLRYQGWLGGDRALWRLIKNQPPLVALYDKAISAEADIRKNPDQAPLYFVAGLDWKSIAEQGGGQVFFARSLKVYENGIAKFGATNILFYLNAGNLAESLNDYAKAERYYQRAIQISSADESGYIDLANLYSYKMKKTEAEVVAVYNSGGQKMMNPTPLVLARAAYLYRIGDYASALPDYETLVKIFPNNSGYKEIIQEIKQKINAGKTLDK